jgi:hypothetical protein
VLEEASNRKLVIHVGKGVKSDPFCHALPQKLEGWAQRAKDLKLDTSEELDQQ